VRVRATTDRRHTTPTPLVHSLSHTVTHSPPHSHLFNSITGTLSQHRKAIIWRHLRRPPAPTVRSQVNTSVRTLSTNPPTTPFRRTHLHTQPTHTHSLARSLFLCVLLESTSSFKFVCACSPAWLQGAAGHPPSHRAPRDPTAARRENKIAQATVRGEGWTVVCTHTRAQALCVVCGSLTGANWSTCESF
jgi:hypothetical protein